MSKSYRNRISLLLRLPSTKNHVSGRGISNDSYPFSTTPSGSFTQMVSPVSSTLSAPTSLPPPPYSPKNPQSSSVDHHASVSGESIPLTANDLDAEEKARLLKTARKLSRVFGEVPSLPPQHVRPRQSSLHQRSSSLATDSSHSSRNLPRKSPSCQNLPHVNEGISNGASVVKARKSMQYSRTSTSSRSSRSVTSQNTGYPPEGEALPRSTTPTSPTSTQNPRRGRMEKLRRHLGENVPVELVSEVRPLQCRKSLDTISLEKSVKHSKQEKQIRKARSFVVEKSAMGVPIQDAVEFHRRYVQNFGEAGAMHKGQPAPRSKSSPVHAKKKSVPESVDYYEEVDSSSSSSQPDIHQALSEATSPLSPHSSFLSLTPRHSEEDLREDSRRRVDSSISIETTDSSLETVNKAFRERRRRAAKLTQFFGVGYQDITASLPHITRDISQSPTVPGVRVDIKMSNRRFWGDGNGTMRDADIVDVIDKLRDLKAS